MTISGTIYIMKFGMSRTMSRLANGICTEASMIIKRYTIIHPMGRNRPNMSDNFTWEDLPRQRHTKIGSRNFWNTLMRMTFESIFYHGIITHLIRKTSERMSLMLGHGCREASMT